MVASLTNICSHATGKGSEFAAQLSQRRFLAEPSSPSFQPCIILRESIVRPDDGLRSALVLREEPAAPGQQVDHSGARRLVVAPQLQVLRAVVALDVLLAAPLEVASRTAPLDGRQGQSSGLLVKVARTEPVRLGLAVALGKVAGLVVPPHGADVRIEQAFGARES